MNPLTQLMVRHWLNLVATRRRCERGDVPGWVLVTVMTAGLVGALYSVAKPELTDMLSSALHSVH